MKLILILSPDCGLNGTKRNSQKGWRVLFTAHKWMNEWITLIGGRILVKTLIVHISNHWLNTDWWKSKISNWAIIPHTQREQRGSGRPLVPCCQLNNSLHFSDSAWDRYIPKATNLETYLDNEHIMLTTLNLMWLFLHFYSSRIDIIVTHPFPNRADADIQISKWH